MVNSLFCCGMCCFGLLVLGLFLSHSLKWGFLFPGHNIHVRFKSPYCGLYFFFKRQRWSLAFNFGPFLRPKKKIKTWSLLIDRKLEINKKADWGQCKWLIGMPQGRPHHSMRGCEFDSWCRDPTPSPHNKKD